MWAQTIDLKLMADDVARAYRNARFEVFTQEARYSFDPVTLTVGGATDEAFVTTQTDRDSIFAWLATAVTGTSTEQANQVDFGLGYNIQITDLSTGYGVVGPDRLAPHQGICGTGEAPHILGFPYVLGPGARITARFRQGGHASVVRLTLIGVKLYTTPYTTRVLIPEVPA